MGRRVRLATALMSLALWAVPATASDPAFERSVRQARAEIAAFDNSSKGPDAIDPRRKWADYFWTYYEEHNDSIEGSQAAGRALRWLAELKAHQEVIKKSRAIDPQNPAWALGAIQALSEAYHGLDQFHEFFEQAEGLMGVSLNPDVRDAARLALAGRYVKQNQYDKAQPLLQAIVGESSDPSMLRAAKKELCALPYLKAGEGIVRDAWQMPERVLSALGIKPGVTVADIGAGEGYFTFRLAEALQRAGKVYAVEIDPAMIARLEGERHRRGLSNVQILRGTDANPQLPKSSCDVIMFVDAYHEVQDRPAMLEHIKRALKRRGLLAIIDDFPPLGEDHFLREETILNEVAGAGFKLDRKETFLPTQFMLIFRKK